MEKHKIIFTPMKYQHVEKYSTFDFSTLAKIRQSISRFFNCGINELVVIDPLFSFNIPKGIDENTGKPVDWGDQIEIVNKTLASKQVEYDMVIPMVSLSDIEMIEFFETIEGKDSIVYWDNLAIQNCFRIMKKETFDKYFYNE